MKNVIEAWYCERHNKMSLEEEWTLVCGCLTKAFLKKIKLIRYDVVKEAEQEIIVLVAKVIKERKVMLKTLEKIHKEFKKALGEE